MHPKQQSSKPTAITINYNPQITIQGGSAPDIEKSLSAMIKTHKEEIAAAVEDVFKKNGKWATA